MRERDLGSSCNGVWVVPAWPRRGVLIPLSKLPSFGHGCLRELHALVGKNDLVEARVGFEPTNGGFADLSLGPLGYRASDGQYIQTGRPCQSALYSFKKLIDS